MKSIYLDSPYPQPVDGGLSSTVKNGHENVDYLPDTHIRIWYSLRNEFYAAHWHEPMEIVYCTSGLYIMTAEDRTWELRKGDILIIPGNITHSMDMKNECHGFVYFVDLSLLDKIPSAALIQPMISHPSFLQPENTLLYHDVVILLEQMRNEYFSKNSLREIVIYSLMFSLLTDICRYKLNENRRITHIRADVQKEYVDRFNTVLNYINENYEEDITLEQISNRFGFSKYNFSRLFHEYTTYCFSDYLVYRRLKAAESFLIKPDLPITEIAETVGFSNPSTFSRAFKEKNKCTPSEFRLLYQR